MKIVLSLEKRILNYLILNSNLSSDTSLMYGKTGIAIAFYKYGIKHEQQFYPIIHDLLNNIKESLYIDEIFSFEKGLIGIGWGIDYLIIKDGKFKEYASISNIVLDLVTQYNTEILLYNLSDTNLYFLLNYIWIHSNIDFTFNKKPINKQFLKKLLLIINNKKNRTFTDISKLIKDTNINHLKNDFTIIEQYINNRINFQDKDILSYPLGIKNGLSNYLLFN